MPPFDFDIITLAHGSGGLLSHRLLESGVFRVLKNQWLEERHDGAIFQVNAGKMAFSSDSFVISPIFFPGGNIGELAVNGTVNDLAMCGAQARYLSLSFILEEGLPVEEFWQVVQGVKMASDSAGIDIVTGDTKVVERGKGDKIFINTSGIGYLHPKADIRASRTQPGDKVIISGPIATHGVAILSVRKGLEFETDIVSDTTALNHIVMSLLEHFGEAVHFLRDPTRGGVATALNELAVHASVGIRLFEKDIPLRNDVAAACELLGLDPLHIANEGVFIAIVAAEKAADITNFLRKHPPGLQAAVAGEVTGKHPGYVVLHSTIGGNRVVNMPHGEPLPRIC